MAAKKGATGRKRRTSSGGRKGTRKRNEPDRSMETEIILWIVLAMSAVLLISNFGFGGAVGNAISSFFFGLVGLVCYPLPFFLFLGTAFVISNSRNTRVYRKMAGFALLFITACMLMQMVTEGEVLEDNLGAYFKISAEYKTGGGILGGALCRLCVVAFGTAGTYAIILTALMISLVLITQRSIFDMIRKCSRRIYETAERRQEERKEAAKLRQEEKAKQEELEEKRRHRRERTEEEKENIPRAERRKKKKEAISPEKKIPVSKEEVPENPVAQEPEEELPFIPEKAFPIHRGDHLVQDLEEIAVPEEDFPQEKEEKNRKNPKSSPEEIRQGVDEVKSQIAREEVKKKEYKFPPISLLKKGKNTGGDSNAHLRETARKLQDTLHNFGVNVTITDISCGPTVTRYEMQPEQGVKVSKIVSLTDDIKLNLAATDIRIEAPIPGKAAVGIEVPNENNSTVMLRDLIQSEAFKNCPSKLAFAAGKDIGGRPVIADIAKMPHLLIAGATGSGKSVCINTIIVSLLYKATPDEVKLIMIDPKVVELSAYNGIPHLFIPVVTDPKKAAGALNWAVAEMMERYDKFAQYNVRDLKGYNAKVEALDGIEDENKPKKLPQIVIIVDELADLMMVAPGEVEGAICRLAQLARAAGLHLILATQRPSVNVITGLIKANMPSRIAFSVSSGVDSRTIIDMNGAEKLLGKGDMLFYPSGYPKPVRVQGSFVSDKEVQSVVDYLISNNGNTSYNNELEEHMNTNLPGQQEAAGPGEGKDAHDVYFIEAGKLIIDKDKASIGMLQRMFKIGFNRAARIMDQLAEAGVVGPEEGTKPRKILMSKEEFDQYIENQP